MEVEGEKTLDCLGGSKGHHLCVTHREEAV